MGLTQGKTEALGEARGEFCEISALSVLKVKREPSQRTFGPHVESRVGWRCSQKYLFIYSCCNDQHKVYLEAQE